MKTTTIVLNDYSQHMKDTLEILVQDTVHSSRRDKPQKRLFGLYYKCPSCSKHLTKTHILSDMLWIDVIGNNFVSGDDFTRFWCIGRCGYSYTTIERS